MTFQEAVENIKDYTGCGGALLDGLQLIHDDLERCELEDDTCWIEPKVLASYRLVCREMRKLFC